MDLYDISEILQVAIKIEENGQRFYAAMKDKLPDEKAKNIFDFLSREEEKHKETFKSLLDQVEKYVPFESYPDEYFFYLRSYANSLIFSEEELQDSIGRVNTALDAVEFGMAREVESILYYMEMKSFVPERQHNVLEKIINEERKHYIQLYNLKKELKHN